MSQEICPRCQTPIPSESPSTADGNESDAIRQCPRCLLRPPWDTPQGVAITLGPGQSFVPPSVEELSGFITGYDVEALIGQGGMGAVYLGRQQSLDRPVAIKILPQQIAERPGFRERFGQEGRALAKLNHPNIVSVHDFGQAGPYAMLVMELVEGANLREVLSQGRLTQSEALEIIPQLCDALSYAHDEGVVHRDIKPENLLFDGRGRLKITDFGLAKLVESKTAPGEGVNDSNDPTKSPPDQTQGIVGTLHYMAPEQLENPKSVDHRADIYAMGVVFYEMLTGELPIGRFESPSQIVSEATKNEIPKVSIDVRIDEVVLRALEKHPEKRYGSASAVMHDIDEIGKHPSSSSSRILPEEHRRRVRESVHRAGEAAGSFASASFNATGQWVSQAKRSWFKNPRVEIPAYLSIASLLLGLLTGFLFLNEPRGEPPALFSAIIAGLVAVAFARVSLAREKDEDREEPILANRFVLGMVYLCIAIPILVAPIAASFGIWMEIYGEPRDFSRLGWQRDWIQSLGITVAVTGFAWLILLLLHAVFPGLFTTLFRPFVQPMSRRTSIPLAILLVSLSAAGLFGAIRMRYQPYAPGMTVAEEDWDKLSPRDLKDLQYELRDKSR